MQQSIFDTIRGVWLMKHCLECLLHLLNQNNNRRVNWEAKLSKSMLIKTNFSNLLHGCDFLCFNLIIFFKWVWEWLLGIMCYFFSLTFLHLIVDCTFQVYKATVIKYENIFKASFQLAGFETSNRDKTWFKLVLLRAILWISWFTFHSVLESFSGDTGCKRSEAPKFSGRKYRVVHLVFLELYHVLTGKFSVYSHESSQNLDLAELTL